MTMFCVQPMVIASAINFGGILIGAVEIPHPLQPLVRETSGIRVCNLQMFCSGHSRTTRYAGGITLLSEPHSVVGNYSD